MTERTLEKAIDIKNNIDKLREMKNSLEYHQRLCWGNTTEVHSRTFGAVIHENGSTRSVEVSPESLKMALDNEINQVDRLLKSYLNELYNLN